MAKPPPQDVFGIEPVLPEDTLRFRIWPETQAEELTFAQQPGFDIRAYDRLIGAALDGDRWLFARQDTVEAASRLLPDRDSWYARPADRTRH